MDDSQQLIALLRQVAHDLRGAIGLAKGAVQAMREDNTAQGKLLDLTEKGVERVLLLADRYEWYATCLKGVAHEVPAHTVLANLVERSRDRAMKCFGRASIQVAENITDRSLELAVDGRALQAAIEEAMAFAFRRAESKVSFSLVREDDRPVFEVGCDARGIADAETPLASGEALSLWLMRELGEVVRATFEVREEGNTTILRYVFRALT